MIARLVIISLSLVLSCASPIPTEEVVPLPVKEEIPTKTRPQLCAHLHRKPDDGTWDPVTETYPRNRAWEKCMGVA